MSDPAAPSAMAELSVLVLALAARRARQIVAEIVADPNTSPDTWAQALAVLACCAPPTPERTPDV